MKKKHRLYAVSLIAVVALLLFILRSMSFPTLEIRELVVTGERDVRAITDVRRAVEGELSGSFFTQDLDQIKQAVERLTWVKSVTVTRVWPDSVNVNVVRLEPVARWEDGRLVSADGVVYVPLVEETGKTDGLPLIVADTTVFAPDAVKFLPRFQSIAAAFRVQVKSIAISYRGSWTVSLRMPKDRILRIELGRATSSDVVFDRLKRVLENYERVCETLQACPSFIDARYENAFAARWPDSRFGMKKKDLKRGGS